MSAIFAHANIGGKDVAKNICCRDASARMYLLFVGAVGSDKLSDMFYTLAKEPNAID